MLSYETHVLASGPAPVDVRSGVWYKMAIQVEGTQVTALLNGHKLATVQSSNSTFGMVAMGSGWHETWLDNVNVRNISKSGRF